jgi:hypothetical protein
VKRLHTVSAVMVALLVFASPFPAMCGQCQLALTNSNCHASRMQGLASPDTAPDEMASEHCQHLGQHVSQHLGQNPAVFQAGPATHVASAQSCQDRFCQGLLEATAKIKRANSSRFPQSISSAASANACGPHELLAPDTLQSPIGAPPLTPLPNQPLCASLRI